MGAAVSAEIRLDLEAATGVAFGVESVAVTVDKAEAAQPLAAADAGSTADTVDYMCHTLHTVDNTGDIAADTIIQELVQQPH